MKERLVCNCKHKKCSYVYGAMRFMQHQIHVHMLKLNRNNKVWSVFRLFEFAHDPKIIDTKDHKNKAGNYLSSLL